MVWRHSIDVKAPRNIATVLKDLDAKETAPHDPGEEEDERRTHEEELRI